MSYQGDIAENGLVYFKFTSRTTTGAPTVLAGTPVLSVYKDDGTTETTTGVTLTVDLDTVTGLNQVKIDTADSFYAIGTDYDIVITTGTVGGISVVGEVVGSFSIENRFDEVNVTAISGDIAAADNLELQFDGTGLTGDNFPATQAQVGNLSTSTGGLSVFISTVTETTVGTETNTEASTRALDGTVHSYEDLAGTIDFYYEADVGTNGSGQSILWDGYVQGNGDSADVFAWDWISTTWIQLGNITGSNSTTTLTEEFQLTTSMTGTGANIGKVRFRFNSTSASLVATDRILVAFAFIVSENLIFSSGVAQSGGSNSIQLASGAVGSNGQFARTRVIIIGGTGAGQEAIVTSSVALTDTLTITPAWLTVPDATTVYLVMSGQVHSTVQNGGYDDGFVYFKTGGDTGIEKGVNGTTTNPVGSEADCYTIMSNENITAVRVLPGSNFVLPSDSSGKQFVGSGYTVALNNQEIGETTFFRVSAVTGIGLDTGGGQVPNFTECGIGTVTLPPCTGLDCGFFGTFTIGSEGNFTFGGSSEVFNASLTLDFGSARNASQFFLTDWRGGAVEIQNAGAGTGSYVFEMNGFGDLIVNANCSAITEVTLRGTISRNADVTGITYVEEANFNLTRASANTLTQVNLGLDTAISELGVGIPTATPSLREAAILMYMMSRNKVDVPTSGTDTLEIYNDAGTKITEKLLTDVAGDYSEAKMS